MSKFIAITIAAVLILSLFLTVFSIGDKLDSKDPSDTSATTTSSTLPGSEFYLDDSGEYGYSIVDGFCYFFIRTTLDPGERDKPVTAVAADYSTYEHRVRFSTDGQTWLIPQKSYEISGAYAYEFDSAYLTGGYFYVSYCVMNVGSSAEALNICNDLFGGGANLIQIHYGVEGDELQPSPE